MAVTLKKIFLWYLWFQWVLSVVSYGNENYLNKFTRWKYNFPRNFDRRGRKMPIESFNRDNYWHPIHQPSPISTQFKMLPFAHLEAYRLPIQSRTYPESSEPNSINSSPHDFNYDSTYSSQSSFSESQSDSYSSYTSSYPHEPQQSSPNEPITVTLTPSHSSLTSYDSTSSQYIDSYPSNYNDYEPHNSYYDDEDPYSVPFQSRAFPGYISSGRPYGTPTELSPAINRYFYTGYRDFDTPPIDAAAVTSTTVAPTSETPPTLNETKFRSFYYMPHHSQRSWNYF